MWLVTWDLCLGTCDLRRAGHRGGPPEGGCGVQVRSLHPRPGALCARQGNAPQARWVPCCHFCPQGSAHELRRNSMCLPLSYPCILRGLSPPNHTAQVTRASIVRTLDGGRVPPAAAGDPGWSLPASFVPSAGIPTEGTPEGTPAGVPGLVQSNQRVVAWSCLCGFPPSSW